MRTCDDYRDCRCESHRYCHNCHQPRSKHGIIGLRRLGEFAGTFDYVPAWEVPAVTPVIPGIDEVITWDLGHTRVKLRVYAIEWGDDGEVHLDARLEEYAVPLREKPL